MEPDISLGSGRICGSAPNRSRRRGLCDSEEAGAVPLGCTAPRLVWLRVFSPSEFARRKEASARSTGDAFTGTIGSLPDRFKGGCSGKAGPFDTGDRVGSAADARGLARLLSRGPRLSVGRSREAPVDTALFSVLNGA